MWQYTVRRLIQMIPSLIGVVTLIFILLNSIPGNPVLIWVGPNPERRVYAKQLIKNFGLDQPLHVRYIKYLQQLAHFNLGVSIIDRQPVTKLIMQRLPITLYLALLSVLFAVSFSIPVGIYSSTHRNKLSDHISRIFALWGLSTPNFWLGLMLIILFSYKLHWLPSGGYISPLKSPIGFIRSMIMPVITLGTSLMASSMRITRSSMLEVLREDYITTSRAYGISEIKILIKYAFKNASLAVITVIGIQIAVLFGGALVTEVIFALPGMGRLTFQALLNRDYPTLMGTTLVFAIIFLFSTLLVDLAYAFLDPRIRYG